MSRISINATGRWLTKLEGGMLKAAKLGLYSAGLRLQEHIQTGVIPGEKPPPVDRGTYRAAWKTKREGDGSAVLVYNATTQALFIERGVRAGNVKIGRAMISALAEWVRRKNIGAKTTISKKGVARVKKATLEEATSIAWAIAKGMQKRGIFNRGEDGGGLRVLAKAEKMAPKYMREEIARELKLEAARAVR